MGEQKQSSVINREIFFNVLPARKEERIYGLWDMMAVQICFGIASWFFLVGSLTGLTLRAVDAIPTVLVGNILPLFLIAPLAIMFSRYGVEQFAASSAFLGHKFKDWWLFLYITSSYGWIAYSAYLFGSAAVRFIGFLGGPKLFATHWPGATIFAIIACIIGLYVAYLGPDTLSWFTKLCAILLLIVLGGFVWYIISVYGLHNIMALEPAEPFETLAWSRASAFEFNVGLGFSWAFWYGQWTRLTKSESAAYHGCQWGYGLLSCIAGVFSALTALVMGVYDPSAWIIGIGLASFAVIGLLMFAFANIGSISCLVYPMSIALRSRYPNMKWLSSVLICSLPAIILMNEPVFNRYDIYLAFIALFRASCTSPCLKKLSCGGQKPARRQQNFRSEKAKNAL